MIESFPHKKHRRHRLKTRGNTTYYTFVPDSLSDDLAIEMDNELASLLSVAHRLLGQLEGMSAFLPNKDAVESILICKEALLSCQIDGIDAPFYSIIDSTKKNEKKYDAINCYILVMRYGLSKLTTSNYKNNFLRDIHKALMRPDADGVGSFRKEQIFLSNLISISGHEKYNPTSPEDIPSALADLEKFIKRKDGIDSLIKTALAHYQFEAIHPFLSGNGRVGRILSYLILSDEQIFTYPIFCLSHYLALNKVEYIDRMERLHQVFDYEQWIKFFIKSIIYATDDALNKIKSWLSIREKNLKKIENSDKTIKALKTVYEIIERYPIIDVSTLAEKAGISYNTGATALKILEELGIMQQSNDMMRNRDYAYKEFLDCFLGESILSQRR